MKSTQIKLGEMTVDVVLKNIKNVIAVASEPSKATSILGALRTGAIDILATSLANVHSIMAMDRAYG